MIGRKFDCRTCGKKKAWKAIAYNLAERLRRVTLVCGHKIKVVHI